MASIILIDDEEVFCEVIAMVLTQAGHSVRTASEGSAGVALYRAEPTDIVITDLIMPGKEGIETIRELRRLQPKLPIIAISGGRINSDLYLHLAGKLGAHRTLTKPFSSAELLKAINEILPKAKD